MKLVLYSIVEALNFRTFDYVRLAKCLGEFDYVGSPNPIEVNRTIGVRLSSITERSIDYAGLMSNLKSNRELLATLLSHTELFY